MTQGFASIGYKKGGRRPPSPLGLGMPSTSKSKAPTRGTRLRQHRLIKKAAEVRLAPQTRHDSDKEEQGIKKWSKASLAWVIKKDAAEGCPAPTTRHDYDKEEQDLKMCPGFASIGY